MGVTLKNNMKKKDEYHSVSGDINRNSVREAADLRLNGQ